MYLTFSIKTNMLWHYALWKIVNLPEAFIGNDDDSLSR